MREFKVSFYIQLMYVAPSKIPGAGLGVFAKKPIPWNFYVGEYAGELLTNDDAERRGILYDAMKRNYFFEVASNAVVDAFRSGTLLRFINHQSNDCNLEPRGAMSLFLNSYRKPDFWLLMQQFGSRHGQWITADCVLFYKGYSKR